MACFVNIFIITSFVTLIIEVICATKSLYFYETVIGKIGIVDSDGIITNLYFDTDSIPSNEKASRAVGMQN